MLGLGNAEIAEMLLELLEHVSGSRRIAGA
jgi:hypothetical protein